MKYTNLMGLIVVLILSVQIVTAQSSSKRFNLTDFDKVEIENVNGQIEIELGKPFAISVSENEVAEEQLEISKVADRLIIQLKKQYSDDWKKRKPVIIKIAMPEISKLLNNSNADISIKKFVGRYLGINNTGNGNIILVGSVVDFIEIENNGNGNIDTKNIIAKKVAIIKSGNGDVTVTTANSFSVKMAGNGDIITYGTGKAVIEKQSGNGKVVYANAGFPVQ